MFKALFALGIHTYMYTYIYLNFNYFNIHITPKLKKMTIIDTLQFLLTLKLINID